MSDKSSDNPPVSTKRGDDGTTTLLGAGRLGKDDPKIAVLGDIDEATSFIGVARAEANDAELAELAELLIASQRLLYRIMGDVAMPNEDNFVGEDDVKFVEDELEKWRDKTELPKEFVIPGETRLGSLLDVSRSVVRRAERTLVSAGYATGHPDAIRAVNRLSDLLFIVARNADKKRTLSRGS